MTTPELTDADFMALSEANRAHQSGSSTFFLNLDAEGTIARLGFHSSQSELLGLSLELPETPSEHASDLYFDGKKYLYPAQNAEAITHHISKRNTIVHPPAPHTERSFKDAAPQLVTAVGAAALISQVAAHDPSRIAFYTGAGASKGGEVPLHDHPGLLDSFGASFYKKELPDIERNKAFCREFLQGGAKPAEVYDAFQGALQAFSIDVSSPAHCAISSIVRQLGREPRILTTNHDLKHEGRGSRLGAIHVPPFWHSEFCLAPETAQAVQTFVATHRNAIDLLVVAGVRRDYRRLFNAIQGDNDMRVLAVDPSEQVPPYLASSDYLVQASAQTALPEIAQALANLEK